MDKVEIKENKETKETNPDINKLNINDPEQNKTEATDLLNDLAGKDVLQQEDTDKILPMSSNNEGPENELSESQDLSYSSNKTWEELKIREDIYKNLLSMGFATPSKIQASTFDLIANPPYGNLIAQAPNGCGKTGAFGIPVLHRINENEDTCQAVIFSHNRQMVNQTAEVLQKMCKDTKIQVRAVLENKKGMEFGHITVSTPGNFEKVLQKKLLNIKTIKVLVLDEADYMIDNDACIQAFKLFCDYLVKENMNIQFCFFSATYLKEHFNFIKKYCKRANQLEVKRESLTLVNVKQMYFKCNRTEDKIAFIEQYLKTSIENERCIIFVNTAKFTVELKENLSKRGYKVYLLMGKDMDRDNRDLTIKKFVSGEIQILITTDIISRGFDEKLVKLVINFDIPVNYKERSEPAYDVYLHRIGRTGRFGSRGIGLNLVKETDRIDELALLKKIEKYYASNIVEIKSIDSLMEEFKKIINNKF